MSFRKQIDPKDLTDEDRDIWLMLTCRGGRLYGMLSIWQSSAIADDRDAGVMFWIGSQAAHVRKKDKQYGRRLRCAHPLARIGMST